MVVDNKPGGAGLIAGEMVVKSPPDGMTVLLGTTSSMLTNKYLYKKPPYDPLADLTPLVRVCLAPIALVVTNDVPAQNLQEFMAWLRANKGKLSYGSYGIGSHGQLACTTLSDVAGADMAHVAYKGEAPMIQDLLGGQIKIGMGSLLSIKAHIDSGRLRAFNALIVRAQPGPFDGSLQTWLIEAVDACAFMGAGRNSRIYLRKNVIEITEQLLGEWRTHSPVLAGCFDFDTRQLTPDRYPQREMSIQWNESDPAFLMRLWRKHGIAWGVRAEAETSPTDPPRHTLVLVDDSAQLPANPEIGRAHV